MTPPSILKAKGSDADWNIGSLAPIKNLDLQTSQPELALTCLPTPTQTLLIRSLLGQQQL